MNPVLFRFTRSERRMLTSAEARARNSGQWGTWEIIRFPRKSAGSTWAADFEMAHKNKVFSVLDRTLPDGTRHLAVSSLTGVRPTWPEMQRIKNELAGDDATAVEVYPPQMEVIDEADMFHIWVLPTRLPFTLADYRRRA